MRPGACRANVAAIWADSVGLTSPGRNATRNASDLVSRASSAAVMKASSHHAPVGMSAPVNPKDSAARTIEARYSMDASRSL